MRAVPAIYARRRVDKLVASVLPLARKIRFPTTGEPICDTTTLGTGKSALPASYERASLLSAQRKTPLARRRARAGVAVRSTCAATIEGRIRRAAPAPVSQPRR